KLNGVFYDITYTLNGGVNDTANPVHFSPKQEISLQPATKEGDVFEGWFLDSNFTIPVEKIAATAEGNQKLFAKWQSGYSITYVNDDTYLYGSLPNPTYRYADSATFKLKEPIGTGRTFDGWYTDSTFTTRVTELPTGNTEDIVLYAKWISHEVKLVYRLNGGTIGAGENPDKVMNGEKILFKTPIREGYVFDGWYDGSKQYGSLKRYRNEPYHVNTNADQVILYARWTYEPKKPEVDADGCYLVTNANELYYLNPYYNTNAQAESLPYRACIKIMNDIVVNPGLPQEHLAVIEWKPLNSLYPFIGIIYGNGHVINGLYMDYELSYPGQFYGLISSDVFDGEYPEVRNLGMKNFFYDNTFYTYTVYINYKGSPGYKIGIQKKMAPAPLKQNRLPKYDAKGRALKVRPNYGVLF
ncbi:MAG: InlB B-repeat-containing protein, partial [Fibrobacter sp.]|nr:InlB B-repeat-containing protein [Fibrobacter sp.]